MYSFTKLFSLITIVFLSGCLQLPEKQNDNSQEEIIERITTLEESLVTSYELKRHFLTSIFFRSGYKTSDLGFLKMIEFFVAQAKEHTTNNILLVGSRTEFVNERINFVRSILLKQGIDESRILTNIDESSKIFFEHEMYNERIDIYLLANKE